MLHDLISNNKINSKIFSIGEYLNNQNIPTNVNLKWPFVGSQFDGVEWKSGVEYKNVEIVLMVKFFSKIQFGFDIKICIKF